jgi:hypothetical protein
MRWEEYVVHMAQNRCAYKTFVWKTERNRPLGRLELDEG